MIKLLFSSANFFIIVKCLDFSDKTCDIEDKVLCNSIVDLHDTPAPCSGWRTSRKMQEKIFRSGLIWMLKITYNFHLFLQSRRLELAEREVTGGHPYVRHCIGPGQTLLPQGSLALITSPRVLSFDNTGSRIWRSVINEYSL